MNYINMTPHTIRLNDGRSFPPSGKVVRVNSAYIETEDDIYVEIYGSLDIVPEADENTYFIVLAVVLRAAQLAGRYDFVAPATGHPDVVRDESGQILSVPGFVK